MAENRESGRPPRWASRRFLLAAAGMAVAVLVALGKVAPEETGGAVQVIVGAATLVLSLVGYQVTEASVDKARASQPSAASQGGDRASKNGSGRHGGTDALAGTCPQGGECGRKGGR